jgi:hypothetical protein
MYSTNFQFKIIKARKRGQSIVVSVTGFETPDQQYHDIEKTTNAKFDFLCVVPRNEGEIFKKPTLISGQDSIIKYRIKTVKPRWDGDSVIMAITSFCMSDTYYIIMGDAQSIIIAEFDKLVSEFFIQAKAATANISQYTIIKQVADSISSIDVDVISQVESFDDDNLDDMYRQFLQGKKSKYDKGLVFFYHSEYIDPLICSRLRRIINSVRPNEVSAPTLSGTTEEEVLDVVHNLTKKFPIEKLKEAVIRVEKEILLVKSNPTVNEQTSNVTNASADEDPIEPLQSHFWEGSYEERVRIPPPVYRVDPPAPKLKKPKEPRKPKP